MKKRLLNIVLLICTLMILVGCSNQKAKIESTTFRVSVPDGIPALTMTKMIKEKTLIDENINLDYSIEKTTDALAAKVLSAAADIAIVPSNLAAQLYNKELGYKIAATGSWGSFYMISEEEIRDPKVLIGREITTIGKNLTPDIMLRHILNLKDIKADSDVIINYLNGATELAPNYLSGKTEIVSVPEPMLSVIMSKKPDTKIILDFNEEWRNAYNSKDGYPQSSLIIKGDILLENKEFIDKFLEEYEKSIIWANKNPVDLGEYSAELGLAISPEILPVAIERTNMKYVPIEESRADYSQFFNVLLEIDPKTIGGKIPDEGLYFK